MKQDTFTAMVVEEQGDTLVFGPKTIGLDDLHQGDILIKVAYSSVNYKDMLAVQKNAGVIRNYPMIPGIDLAGVVVSSDSPDFSVGQEVLVTGYEMGMSHTGGFAQYARIPHEWVVPLPAGLSMKDAMIIGTAGLTAGLSVLALENAGMKPQNAPRLLVTGASGGVGSVALAILKHLGYPQITALTRKDNQDELVRKLGATDIIKPEQIFLKENPLLLKGIYDYVLDTVGGDVVSHLIPQIDYDGAISLCGNAAGVKVATNVLPFILRGVQALGIDSVQISHEKRCKVWEKFASEWNICDNLTYNEIRLEELPNVIQELKEGRHLGRTIVVF
ncbi:YhdH/YhfP family quinone oxidoreductase [Streptococcus suis]|uniref:Acryloyl-CoA reductase n=1 Tax=Streptococcus suis TaxID=1307 RepID=A0A4T2GPV8_STRSU|nr:YhdH/YhfP family quinone oxidoreductase [Streptococcus suis]MBM7269071.1 YhdH/YhfP family quinone oxidoreductase [Streptococcus suis]TII01108.1 acryloyl-CoA reductase [Streptococcus suis]